MKNEEKLKKIIVSPKESIKEVASKIDKSGLKVAVVEEGKKVVGILTDSDIRKSLLQGVGSNEPVEKVMQKDFFYVKKLEEIDEKKIQRKKIEAIPIINDEKKFLDLALYSFKKKRFLKYLEEEFQNKPVRKVLVIGGAGYIGSILVRDLLERGYSVTVLDKFVYGKESLEGISSDLLRVIEGDARHIEDVSNAVEGVDAVVHLAEIVGDPAAALNPKVTQENNYLATKMVAEVCKYFQINRMVYASSCSVYGASEEGTILKENSKLNPVSLYAKMKIASEEALNEMTDNNFKPTILRFATVFGQSHRTRFDLVVNLLTAKAFKDKEITIFNGDQWRPFVHVKDLSKTIISVIESPLEKVGGEVFNVGNQENNYKINDVGKMIKESIPEAEIKMIGDDPDKRNYRVCFDKLEKSLNLKLKVNLKEGIEEVKKFLNSNPNVNYNDKNFSNIKFLLENKEIFC